MKKAIIILIVLLVFGTGVVVVSTHLVAEGEKPAAVRCSDFRTQPEAQNAYERGERQLDGRDKDQLACESLPLK